MKIDCEFSTQTERLMSDFNDALEIRSQMPVKSARQHRLRAGKKVSSVMTGDG